MGNRVTLQTIADQLGISPAAVSKALKGQKGVSASLRQKVLDLAQSEGYQQTVHAGRRDDSFTRIRVFVPARFLDQEQSFYWMLYQELSRAARPRHGNLYLEVVEPDMEQSCLLPPMGAPGRTDGAIIMGAFHPAYKRMLSGKLNLPYLFLDTEWPDGEGDSLISDNLEGGMEMTSYLLRHGHRRIGYFGTLLQTESIDDRYFGYYKALMHHGIALDPALVVNDRAPDGISFRPEDVAFPDNLPTAFFCNCDASADLLIRALGLRGLRVPDDISVAGFDNYAPLPGIMTQVTTWEVSLPGMAQQAISLLYQKLQDPAFHAGRSILPGRLIERDSVRTVGDPVPLLI